MKLRPILCSGLSNEDPIYRYFSNIDDVMEDHDDWSEVYSFNFLERGEQSLEEYISYRSPFVLEIYHRMKKLYPSRLTEDMIYHSLFFICINLDIIKEAYLLDNNRNIYSPWKP